MASLSFVILGGTADIKENRTETGETAQIEMCEPQIRSGSDSKVGPVRHVKHRLWRSCCLQGFKDSTTTQRHMRAETVSRGLQRELTENVQQQRGLLLAHNVLGRAANLTVVVHGGDVVQMQDGSLARSLDLRGRTQTLY